ncbi:MAG: phosphotransferase family protein [Sphingobium sp.]|uniref:phosphotransferase family protein n=1 Tax=Sphingobium sp. TaxID=1912891 RepID=UPI0029B1A590|nr:phosphotransferase family protein [Sphingobium sp.]MDX3909553.1 phosphotransferase family protein [Sphingobium sp.]
MLAENIAATASALPFDQDRLVCFLRDHLPGLAGTPTIRRFKGGQSNPTFLIEGEGGRYVLRKKPDGAILPSAHQIEREFRVMRALADTPVPVPHMYVLHEDPELIGTAFYVMEAMEGRIFHDCTMPGVAPQDRRAMYLGMAETLADLHGVDWRAAGLDGFGRPDAYLERQVALWTRQFDKSRTEPIEAMDRLSQWLAAHVPAGGRATIAHGDYRVGNLVFDPQGTQVRAVLDWELATIGHPLADLAYNCLPYRLVSGLPGIPGLADVDIGTLGIPSEREMLDHYGARSGQGEIADWNYYLAFALFRTAAILQGIHARALQNNAANEDALQVGRNAAYVAGVGWACARG